MSQRRLLVTSALPYANGELHLGHLLEHIQSDIWVRFQRLRGHNVAYVCGSDAHGTPIMLKAEKEGIPPETLIENVRTAHAKDFTAFRVDYDNFYTTHSDENREFTELMFKRLEANGDIITKEVDQAFDTEKQMFLPDRYVKGQCPRCGADDQYGDSCEACGATYDPTELVNPKSVLSNTTPVQKSSLHIFFNLEKYKDKLQAWLTPEKVQPEIINKLKEFFEEGLKPWDISRDQPYFGFAIPGYPDKFFYVWLDAPVGYMASFKQYCDQTSAHDFNEYWKPDSTTELYHFIGKDIIYFHALFWPAVLMGSQFRTPTSVFTHGFLTINGKKMSKSRGTFIQAQTYLEHLNPEYLRYYFAAKLSSKIEDVDLNFEDFIQRVNSDVVGKVVNIASRLAGFIRKLFDNRLAEQLPEPELYQQFVDAQASIAESYEAREFGHAMRMIMELADKANQYVDHHQPWSLAKEEGRADDVHLICTQGLNLFRVLMIYLKPVLPSMAEKVEAFLQVEPLSWNDINTPLLNHAIIKFKPLIQRVDPECVSALMSTSSETVVKA